VAHLRYRVTGITTGTLRKRITGRFPDTETGRREKDALVATLRDVRVVYDVRVRIGDRDVSKTFTRRRDATAYAQRVDGAKLDGRAVDPREGRERFDGYARSWITIRIVKGRPLTPMTVRGYESLLRRHLEPTFGKVHVSAITTERVAAWYAVTVSEHGPDAAAKSYRLLRAILNTAVEHGKIAQNPCRIKGAGTEHREERPLVDTATVLALADAIHPRLRALVLLAGFGGLRTGESLGLRRQDVDLLHRKVSVVQQVHEVTGRGRIVVPHAKSEAGRRDVVLPAVVVDVLIEHLDAYADPAEDALVFTGPAGGPLYRTRISAYWARACAEVGVTGLRLHDLRHHAATLTARKPGVTTKELMARLGHASPRAALIYQHASEERDQEVAEFMDAQIAAARSDEENKAQIVELAGG